MVSNIVILLNIDSELNIISNIVSKYLKIPTNLRYHISRRFPILDRDDLSSLESNYFRQTPYYPYVGLVPLMDSIDSYFYQNSSVSDLYVKNNLLEDGGMVFTGHADGNESFFIKYYKYIVENELYTGIVPNNDEYRRLTKRDAIIRHDSKDYMFREKNIIDNKELENDINQLVAITNTIIDIYVKKVSEYFQSHILKCSTEGKDIVIRSYGEAGILRYNEACDVLGTCKRSDENEIYDKYIKSDPFAIKRTNQEHAPNRINNNNAYRLTTILNQLEKDAEDKRMRGNGEWIQN